MPFALQGYGGKLFFSDIFLLQKDRFSLLSCVKKAMNLRNVSFFMQQFFLAHSRHKRCTPAPIPDNPSIPDAPLLPIREKGTFQAPKILL
ncbi:MAG: hypothetical protein II117_06155 [Clostridia bacterium]|nr:hypothetical protein [Clostridia bacterium]